MEPFSLAQFETISQRPVFDDMQDYINIRNMRYGVDDLIEAGFLSETDALKAIQDSINWLVLSGQEPKQYFYSCYICDPTDNTVYRHWKMNKKGFITVIIHAPVLTQRLAKIRWKLLGVLLF